MTPDDLPFPPDTILAGLRASPLRLFLALSVTVALGLFLIALGFVGASGFVAQLVLIAMGAGLLWQAARLYAAAQGAIFLTREGLFDQDGTRIIAMDEIVSVSRGAFALKPSGGFTLGLERRQPRAFVPGLWWRIGRRLGVGGVVGQGAARFMAEVIAIEIDRR